ncbi:MAG: PKD domain-containing protein, partial [Planctomycetota bacterium]
MVPADYPTIQQAIDNSNNGDIVIVETGTYPENINFSGKNITVTGTDPENPEIVEATIIDGQNIGSVVVFENGETSEAVLRGFTIIGGYGTANLLFGEELVWGAGIYCINASPTIKNNVIADNYGALKAGGTANECYGGAIACIGSEAIITNNIIRNNTSFAGAGIMTYPYSDPDTETVFAGHTMISNNLIYNNSAQIGGGIVLLYNGQLINNTIVGNDSSLGGDGEGYAGNIYTASEPEFGLCEIINNIVCNAKSGSGIFSAGQTEDLIAFNNVWNNTGGNYSSQNPETGEMTSGGHFDRTGKDGNISRDPLFFRGSYNISADSPCYEAGDPNYVPYLWQRDIHGEYAVMGARVDIGADEFTADPRPVADAGDDQFFDELVANVTLDGTGSYDFDAGDDMYYQWRQTSGSNVIISNPDTPEPNFAPIVEGIFAFELTVFDGSNYSVPDSVMIVVGNRAPFADAGDDLDCEPRKEATLDGSESYDLDEEDTL